MRFYTFHNQVASYVTIRCGRGLTDNFWFKLTQSREAFSYYFIFRSFLSLKLSPEWWWDWKKRSRMLPTLEGA